MNFDNMKIIKQDVLKEIMALCVCGCPAARDGSTVPGVLSPHRDKVVEKGKSHCRPQGFHT